MTMPEGFRRLKIFSINTRLLTVDPVQEPWYFQLLVNINAWVEVHHHHH
jgi:hypothetical protein